MKYFKKLIGERIYLSPRNSENEEIEKFTEWLNDFETTDYIGNDDKTYWKSYKIYKALEIPIQGNVKTVQLET